MRKQNYFFQGLALIIISATQFYYLQNEPWTAAQLMEPGNLATLINDTNAIKPLVINIGPAGSIKGAVKTGPAREKDNLKDLKKLLSNEDRKREIVIYCGCCPFKDCPNIRPAFLLLTEMKFINHKLLNLPHNLKMDWINHGYPMNK